LLGVLGADEKNEVVLLPLPNKFVVGAVVVVVDPSGLGSNVKVEVGSNVGCVNVAVAGLLEVVVGKDPKPPKPPKTDGFGASAVVVELALLPNGKGRDAAGIVVELGGDGANGDGPGVLDVAVSFAGIENGLGALDEPNALLVALKSGKLGLDVGKVEAFVEGVSVDGGADFKLSNPANEGGGAGIEGILVFVVPLALEESSNSF